MRIIGRLSVAANLALAVLAAACSAAPSKPATISSLAVSVTDSSVAEGVSTTVAATATDSKGVQAPVTLQAAWTSSASNVALVDCSDRTCTVTTSAVGTAELTATYL